MMKPITAVPTTDKSKTNPPALSCSIQSVLPTTSLRFGVQVRVRVRRREDPVSNAPSVPPTA